MPCFCANGRIRLFSVFSACRNEKDHAREVVLDEKSGVVNGMLSMRKVISEKGKKTIEAFVKENLSGRVNESTVQAYIDMAKSNMDIHGGLPSLEISMCFSLTGDEESLDLEKDDVAYEDCVFDNADELCAVFGKEILDALKKAGFEKQTENFGEIWQACANISHDGYEFRVCAVKKTQPEKKIARTFTRSSFWVYKRKNP